MKDKPEEIGLFDELAAHLQGGKRSLNRHARIIPTATAHSPMRGASASSSSVCRHKDFEFSD